MRATLDPVDPQPLRKMFAPLLETLQRAGVVKEYHFWQDYVLVAVDGVEHFSSAKVHCAHCLTRTVRDQTTSYYHAGLAAVLVHPAHAEVFSLDFEPILNQDGAVKNDCERNAAKRLLTALQAQYPDLKIILIEDAIYANAPYPPDQRGERALHSQRQAGLARELVQAIRGSARDRASAGMELQGCARHPARVRVDEGLVLV